MFSRLVLFAASAVVALASSNLPANFQTLDASKKMEILMNNINAHPYDTLPTEDFGVATKLKMLVPTFLVKAFTWVGDEMIQDRPKLIHTYGSCAKASLEIFPNSTFSGIFKPNAKSDVIVRLSLAVTDATNKYTPGMAIKIPVSKEPSFSLITMYSTAGQGTDKNFFANTFTNQIPDGHGLALKVVGFQFAMALKLLPGGDCDRPADEGKLPMYTPSSKDQAGVTTAKPAPLEVINFVPEKGVAWSKDDTNDFRTLLAKIEVGAVLYKLASKPSRDSPDSKVFGQLVLKSKLVASDYCDSKLYFQHHAKRC